MVHAWVISAARVAMAKEMSPRVGRVKARARKNTAGAARPMTSPSRTALAPLGPWLWWVKTASTHAEHWERGQQSGQVRANDRR